MATLTQLGAQRTVNSAAVMWPPSCAVWVWAVGVSKLDDDIDDDNDGNDDDDDDADDDDLNVTISCRSVSLLCLFI